MASVSNCSSQFSNIKERCYSLSMKTLTQDDWNEVYSPIPICSLVSPLASLTEKWRLVTFQYDEDGLGNITAVIVECDGVVFWIWEPTGNVAEGMVSVSVRSYEPDTTRALEVFLSGFSLSCDDLHWVPEGLGSAAWGLWRYDDNSNERLMFKFHSEEAAQYVQRSFEKRGHRQIYFVKQIS